MHGYLDEAEVLIGNCHLHLMVSLLTDILPNGDHPKYDIAFKEVIIFWLDFLLLKRKSTK